MKKQKSIFIIFAIGQVVNFISHGYMILQTLDHQLLIRSTIQKIPIEEKLNIEELLQSEGLFDFILGMQEFPSQITMALHILTFGLVLSLIINGWVFFLLLKHKRSAYLYVWSIVVFTLFLGISTLDIKHLVVGAIMSVLLYKVKNQFKGTVNVKS